MKKICLSVLLIALVMAFAITNIKPSYAFNENLFDDEYTYNIAPSKIYLNSKDISPLTNIEVKKLFFTYKIDVVHDGIEVNEIYYPMDSVILIITGYHCELTSSYYYNGSMLSQTLYYSWNRQDVDGFEDTQELLNDNRRLYIPLDYKFIKSGELELTNVMSYSPEVYFNIYNISNVNELNGLTRYGIATYISFDLWAENNTSQRVVLRNNNNYVLNDTRFFNVDEITTLPRINYDTTFKDINYIYIDTLVKNATIRNYLDEHPADNDLENVDFSDWITTAVGGFLDFEIVPGLSLSNILMLILAIGLLFLFLRFFAGG